jgi:hypothetical protein
MLFFLHSITTCVLKYIIIWRSNYPTLIKYLFNYELFFLTKLQEEFEDTQVVIRIRISKHNRKHNGQKKKYKRTNNDLQNIQ